MSDKDLKPRTTGRNNMRFMRVVGGASVSLILLFFTLRNVTSRGLWNALGRVDHGYLLLALLSVVTNVVAKTVRWQVLLGLVGRQAGFLRVLRSLVVGQV